MRHFQLRIRDIILRPVIFVCLVMSQQNVLADDAGLALQATLKGTKFWADDDLN